MRPIAVLALAVMLAGCGLARNPGLVLPAFEAKFEDRVWREEGPAAAPGAIRVFMSDGTMLTADCAGTYRLASWRRIDDMRLVWEEGTAVTQAEIAGVGPRELGLFVDPEGAATPLTFRRVEAPLDCAAR